MRILLVKPYNSSDHIQPSLGLGYLAAAVRASSEVKILDCIKEKIKIDQLVEMVGEYGPDLVGFQCYTFDLNFIKNALGVIKKTDRDTVTVLGGPHPSAVPRESLEYFGGDLDYLFTGEAEKGFALLVDKLQGRSGVSLSEIPGLAWKENGLIKINPSVFIEDLDSLGMPAWDLIIPEHYPEAQHGAFFKKFPIAPIMATRGCPFPCTFCAGSLVTGKRIRKHSAGFMINQIEYLYHKRGIREFHIIDDNFTFDKDFAKDFLKKLIGLKLDISWATPNGVRIDSLDEELLMLMKKSGLYLISLGIESGSDRVLGLMKKNTTVEKIRRGIAMINNFQIEVAGFFIVGFPGETEADIRKTIRFSLELDLVRANYFTYLPFPGTSSYKELSVNNELKMVDFERFYFMTAPYVPKGLTRRKLRSLQRLAFLRFYRRPRIIYRNLCDIMSFKHCTFLLKRFLRWIVMH